MKCPDCGNGIDVAPNGEFRCSCNLSGRIEIPRKKNIQSLLETCRIICPICYHFITFDISVSSWSCFHCHNVFKGEKGGEYLLKMNALWNSCYFYGKNSFNLNLTKVKNEIEPEYAEKIYEKETDLEIKKLKIEAWRKGYYCREEKE